MDAPRRALPARVRLGPQGHSFGWLIVYDRELPGLPMKPEEVFASAYRAGGIHRDEAIQDWIRAARRVIAAAEVPL